MRVAAALAVALVAFAPAVASAGPTEYVSLGVGATANTSGDLSSMDSNGTAGSLFVGHSMGMFSLEAGLSKYGFKNSNQSWSNLALGAAGKLTVPVMPMLGAYLRVGIEKTWSDGSANSGDADYTGTGWMAGIGAAYKLNLGATSGAVWADLTRHDASFVNDARSRDGSTDVISIGITVGF
jgi:hypothetical protein